MGKHSDSVSNDLFVRLSKYRPTESRSSLENFFTELVAYIIRGEPDARLEFIEAILGSNGRHEFAKCIVDTQWSHKDMIFDLVLRSADESDGKMLIVENKIDSPLADSQLDKYLAFARGKAGRTVAVLAKTHQSAADRAPDAVYTGQVLWSQIAERWSKLINRRDSRLLDNVLEFMRREGMGPFEPFVVGEIEVPGLNRSLNEKVNRLIADVRDRIPNGESFLTEEDVTVMQYINAGGYNGIGWWAPKTGTQSGADFWYFIGFAPSVPGSWWPALQTDGEAEALAFIGMWHDTVPVGKLLAEKAKLLLEEGDFKIEYSQNRGGLFLLRRKPLRDFLGADGGRIVEFLLDSHQRIWEAGVLPDIYMAFRSMKTPKSVEEKG